MKLFSTRVKELFDPIVMPEKRRRVFALFESIFMRTNLSITLGNFSLQNANLRREICIQLKTDLKETGFAMWKIIIVIWVTCVQKNSQIRTFIQGLLAKYQFFFQEIAPIFHIIAQILFSKYNWQLIDQLYLPYKFRGSSMRGILFFNFASWKSLRYVWMVFCPCCFALNKHRILRSYVGRNHFEAYRMVLSRVMDFHSGQDGY